jgi:hypothetical protein
MNRGLVDIQLIRLKCENIHKLLYLLQGARLESKALSVYSSSVITLYEELVLLLVRNTSREMLVFYADNARFSWFGRTTSLSQPLGITCISASGRILLGLFPKRSFSGTNGS